MSIKTTHLVTRDFAIKAIKKKLKKSTDSQIENILEEVLHNGFYNFSVVDADYFEKNKKEKYKQAYLEDLDTLPDYNDAW